ncbi:uncharacterized protein DUF4150 [Phyllobacterium myrsinacearum]|uniref:PAAR-like domain-containing protein n=1 Tax=Phyllobacterium myrsinacearum TaxID=28101 RepID=UPI0010288D88|nr:PAAR-like domain-containing protein [Phyllobacterium myrsinacearum]RZS76779.1 uncharacterized protein DUF4150 [Phyllobacterium myrsinacearum]
MTVPVSARKDGANFVYSISPDVCLTPIGSGMVPVGYNTIAFFDTVVRTATTVRNNSNEDFVVNTRPSVCIGHEPGTGKGVKIAGYKSHAVIKQGASAVFTEGWAAVRDGDPAEINRPGPGRVETPRSKSSVGIDHV